jgi:hypothetical protein
MIWSPYVSEFDCVVTEGPNLVNVTFDEVQYKLKPFLQKFVS